MENEILFKNDYEFSQKDTSNSLKIEIEDEAIKNLIESLNQLKESQNIIEKNLIK